METFEVAKAFPSLKKVRELTAEIRTLIFKLVHSPYDSREEFKEDLLTLHDKSTQLDEVLK